MKKKTSILFCLLAILGLASIGFTSCSDDDTPEKNEETADPDKIAPANLIAYWNFNDTPADAKGRDCTATEAVSYVAGIRGKAYQGAENAYISFPLTGADKLATMPAFSIAYWVEFANRAGADAIFSLSGGEVNTTDGVHSVPADHWAASLNIYQDGSNEAISLHSVFNRNEYGFVWPSQSPVTPISVGGWYHMIIRYDNATSTKSYFINGEKVASLEDANLVLDPTADPAIPLGDLHLYLRAAGKENKGVIGAFANKVLGYDVNAWQNTFRGKLDELRIYNKPLTDAEAKQLYDAEFDKRDN